MPKWTETPAGFELAAGALRLAVTDQRARQCGWCWHVIIEHEYGPDQLATAGHLESAYAAKAAAVVSARSYCEGVLAALAAVEAVQS